MAWWQVTTQNFQHFYYIDGLQDPTLAVKKPQEDDGLVAGDDSSSEDEEEVEAKKRAEEVS